MAVTPPTGETISLDRGRIHGRRAFYVSQDIAAEASHAGSVHIDVSIRPGWGDALGQFKGKAVSSKAVLDALKTAATELLVHSFEAEIGKVVDAYRLMLRESLAKGEDPELQAALNRARLQEKVLASTTMVDQAQACLLLGLSGANPSATMKRKEDKQEVLRFTVDGRAAYPLFQFDVEGRRVFPPMAEIITKKPSGWSNFRLLHWLTRPHLDLGGTPAETLGTDAPAVIAAFGREIEPVMHG